MKRNFSASAFAAVVLGATGCASQLYDGPKRSKAETALIETDGTVITAVDGAHLGAYDDGVVLPGLRAVSFRLDDKHAQSSANDWVQRSSKGSMTVCFVARAGRSYIVRPSYTGGGWRPEIVDETIAEAVRSDRIDESRGCGGDVVGYEQRYRIPLPVPINVTAPSP